MSIEPEILSIPPYISTSWNNILSLQTDLSKENILLNIKLRDGSSVTVPGLERSEVDAIFLAHSKQALLARVSSPSILLDTSPLFSTETLFSLSFPISLTEFRYFTSTLHHDPEQARAPEFSLELVTELSKLALTLGISDGTILPKEEPHCNCPHCQIIRSLKSSVGSSPVKQKQEEDETWDDEVSEEDLYFKSWIIYPQKENRFWVVHPDHEEERYLVNLSSPINCSCKSSHCEHIKAVLSD